MLRQIESTQLLDLDPDSEYYNIINQHNQHNSYGVGKMDSSNKKSNKDINLNKNKNNHSN